MGTAELERGQGCSQQLLGGARAAFGALQRAQLCPAPGDVALARGRDRGHFQATGAQQPRGVSVPCPGAWGQLCPRCLLGQQGPEAARGGSAGEL